MAQPNIKTKIIDAVSWTSIKIAKGTAQRLAELGKKNETYDDIIVKLLNRFERKKAKQE